MQTLAHAGLVIVGSSLGGLARWGTGNLFQRLFGDSDFPLGTFFINISGSLILGWFSTLLAEYWQFGDTNRMHAEEWRLLVAVGFCGAYTTFSTFEGEMYRLFRQGFAITASLYLAGSVFLGLLAFRAGILLAGGR